VTPDQEQLVLDNLTVVYAAVRRLHVYRRDVDDARAAGILGLIEAAEKWEPARGDNFGGFAWVYVRREIVAWFRQRFGRPPHSHPAALPLTRNILATVASADADPSDACTRADTAAALRRIVTSLPPRERFVIEQLFFHDETPTAVAPRLGISTSRIAQVRNEALSRLRCRLIDRGMRN